MPESFITRSGLTPISKKASMMRSEIELWPQPAQRFVLPPRYSRIGRPRRLVLGVGAVGVVAVAVPPGLEQGHQEGQSDGDGDEEEVVDARAGELPAGEVQAHGGSLPSGIAVDRPSVAGQDPMAGWSSRRANRATRSSSRSPMTGAASISTS